MYPELANQVCIVDGLGAAVCHTHERFAWFMMLAMGLIIFQAIWVPELIAWADRLLTRKKVQDDNA